MLPQPASPGLVANKIESGVVCDAGPGISLQHIQRHGVGRYRQDATLCIPVSENNALAVDIIDLMVVSEGTVCVPVNHQLGT